MFVNLLLKKTRAILDNSSRGILKQGSEMDGTWITNGERKSLYNILVGKP